MAAVPRYRFCSFIGYGVCCLLLFVVFCCALLLIRVCCCMFVRRSCCRLFVGLLLCVALVVDRCFLRFVRVCCVLLFGVVCGCELLVVDCIGLVSWFDVVAGCCWCHSLGWWLVCLLPVGCCLLLLVSFAWLVAGDVCW